MGKSSISSRRVLDSSGILIANITLHNDADMRTTVTLDPEAERLLRDAMRRTGQSFEKVPNQAVIKGLANESAFSDEEPFVVSPRPMGLRAGFVAERFNSLVDELEADAFVSLTRDLLNRSKDG